MGSGGGKGRGIGIREEEGNFGWYTKGIKKIKIKKIKEAMNLKENWGRGQYGKGLRKGSWK